MEQIKCHELVPLHELGFWATQGPSVSQALAWVIFLRIILQLVPLPTTLSGASLFETWVLNGPNPCKLLRVDLRKIIFSVPSSGKWRERWSNVWGIRRKKRIKGPFQKVERNRLFHGFTSGQLGSLFVSPLSFPYRLLLAGCFSLFVSQRHWVSVSLCTALLFPRICGRRSEWRRRYRDLCENELSIEFYPGLHCIPETGV